MRLGTWVVAIGLMIGCSSQALAGAWTGYMNVFNNNSGSPGNYLWGSFWGVPDLKTTVINGSGAGATISDNVLELFPNYNTYANALNGSNADRAYWTNSTDGGVTAGPNGNKWLEANTFVEPQSSITLPSYTFSGRVDSATLSSAYKAEAFIKVLDPLAGYTLSLFDRQELTGPTFSITSDLSFYQGQLLQVGFMVSGVNANPTNLVSNGSVRVTTFPTAITINVASGTQTQAQAGYPSISGSSPVYKYGDGTLVLDGTNPFTGPTGVYAGTLKVSNNAGLSASPVTVNAGASLSVAAAGLTSLDDVAVQTGATMSLRSDIAQVVTMQSLAIDSVVALTIDSGTMVNGYMNVFDLPSAGGAYNPYPTSGPYAVADLRADFTSPTSVTLSPCYVADSGTFWYTPSGGPGATGNKIMEANVYGQADGTYAGETVRFSGDVSDYTLLSGSGNWTVKAYIRDFAPDFSSYNEQIVPISTTGTFSVSMTTVNDPARHVQWGLQTTGPDVWITDLASKGVVTVNALAVAAEGGKLDVGRGQISVTSGLTATELVTQIVRGLGDGTWNGAAGITSSAVATDVGLGIPRAVGWVDHGDGSVSFAYAAPGDTNLDWSIDLLDVGSYLAAGRYDTGELATWSEGDYTYDGVVDLTDVGLYLSTGLFDAGTYNPPASGVSAVPEPTVALTAGACCVIAAGARYRRRYPRG